MIENNIQELLHIYDQPLYIESRHMSQSRISAPEECVKVLVLVNHDDMNATTEPMLLKMLAACAISAQDYKVVKTDLHQVINEINHYQPESVLLFGLNVASDAFSLQKENYKPFRFAGRKWLKGDTLVQIAANPALKSALWTSGLKILFNIA